LDVTRGGERRGGVDREGEKKRLRARELRRIRKEKKPAAGRGKKKKMRVVCRTISSCLKEYNKRRKKCRDRFEKANIRHSLGFQERERACEGGEESAYGVLFHREGSVRSES